MVTTCLIALVVIAFYGYRAYVAHAQDKIEQLRAMNEEAQQRQIQEAQAKAEEAKQRQFELSRWTKERDDGTRHVELVLSYPEMRLTTHSRHDDAGYVADSYWLQSTNWERHREWLEEDGWTKDEYMKQHVQEFDVRRLQDGTWEHRPTWKRWRARVLEALLTELPYIE